MSKYNLKKLQIDNKMSALSRMDYDTTKEGQHTER